MSKADIQCIEGHENISLPFVPGTEFAGEVLEVGTNCKENLKPGDRVAVLRGIDKISASCTNLSLVIDSFLA